MEIRELYFLFIAAFLTGVLLILSFPFFSFSFFAWIAFVPLGFYIYKTDKGILALWGGFLSGLIFYFGSTYWIFNVIHTYGRLNVFLSLLVTLLLVLYLSLYFALYGYIQFKLLKKFSLAGALFMAPFLWVGLEFARNYLLTGFPWNLLAYSQFKNIHIIQAARFTGPYGISFLIFLFNSLILYLILSEKLKRKIIFTVSVILVIGITWSYGYYTVNSTENSGKSLMVGGVQGNVKQEVIRQKTKGREVLKRQLELSKQTLKEEAELVVWSESSIPYYFKRNPSLQKLLKNFTEKERITLVLGNMYSDSSGLRNSAYTISRGKIQKRYDKRHLVPYGEYVPLREWLFFVEPLVEEVGTFVPGKSAVLNHIRKYDFGIPICYEVVFPENIRAFTQKGAHFLVNITNDAWFGKSPASAQHLSTVVFRAVENKRYIVRVANTGISAIISDTGRILERTELFKTTYFAGEIEMRNDKTFYVKNGDVFAYLCLFLLILKGGLYWKNKKFRSRE